MSETSAVIILIAAVFTNNILLSNFLGMCSFIACSGQIGTALGLGTAGCSSPGKMRPGFANLLASPRQAVSTL